MCVCVCVCVCVCEILGGRGGGRVKLSKVELLPKHQKHPYYGPEEGKGIHIQVSRPARGRVN